MVRCSSRARSFDRNCIHAQFTIRSSAQANVLSASECFLPRSFSLSEDFDFRTVSVTCVSAFSLRYIVFVISFPFHSHIRNDLFSKDRAILLNFQLELHNALKNILYIVTGPRWKRTNKCHRLSEAKKF